VQQAAHLEQAAWHVVVVGDDDDAAIGVVLDPFGAFLGVADGVERGAVDIDAAGEEPLVAAHRRLQLALGGRRMDAADQQPFALAGRQQVHRGVEARLPAGEHDDGIGLGRVERGGHVADLVGEPAEAAGEKRQGGQGGETADAKGEPQTTKPGGGGRAHACRRHPSGRLDRIPRFHHPQVNPENISWLTPKCGL